MVSASAAEDAARAARDRPGLDVGLHVTLVEERPVLAPAAVPSLVSGERFWPDFRTIGVRYATGRWRPAEARAEIAAQWERLTALGVAASHCDGHQHLHLLPGVLPAVVAQGRQRGVRFVRSRLVEPVWEGGRLGRRLEFLALAGISAAARLLTRPPGDRRDAFVTTGFAAAGGMLTRDRLLAMLEWLRVRGTDVVEVMLHPGRADADTRRRYAHWNYHWDRDLELLCDPVLAGELERRGIEVTSFRELAASSDRGVGAGDAGSPADRGQVAGRA